MNNEYVKFLEQYLSEQTLNPSSEIHEKFVDLVQTVFVKRAKKGERILKAGKVSQIPKKSEIDTYQKYNLLIKEDGTFYLTKKGLMFATGEKVHTNREPSEEEFKKYIQEMKDIISGKTKPKDYPISWYGFVVSIFQNGKKKVYSHEELWKEKRRKEKMGIVAKGKGKIFSDE